MTVYIHVVHTCMYRSQVYVCLHVCVCVGVNFIIPTEFIAKLVSKLIVGGAKVNKATENGQ